MGEWEMISLSTVCSACTTCLRTWLQLILTSKAATRLHLPVVHERPFFPANCGANCQWHLHWVRVFFFLSSLRSCRVLFVRLTDGRPRGRSRGAGSCRRRVLIRLQVCMELRLGHCVLYVHRISPAGTATWPSSYSVIRLRCINDLLRNGI